METSGANEARQWAPKVTTSRGLVTSGRRSKVLLWKFCVAIVLAAVFALPLSESKTHHSKRQAAGEQQQQQQQQLRAPLGGRESTNWWNLWWQQYIDEAVRSEQPTVRPIVSVSFNGQTIGLRGDEEPTAAEQFARPEREAIETNQLQPLADIERQRANERPAQFQEAPQERRSQQLAGDNWNSVRPRLMVVQQAGAATSRQARLEQQQQVAEEEMMSGQFGIQMRAGMGQAGGAQKPADEARKLDEQLDQQQQQQHQMTDYSDLDAELEGVGEQPPGANGGALLTAVVVDSSSSSMMMPERPARPSQRPALASEAPTSRATSSPTSTTEVRSTMQPTTVARATSPAVTETPSKTTTTTTTTTTSAATSQRPASSQQTTSGGVNVNETPISIEGSSAETPKSSSPTTSTSSLGGAVSTPGSSRVELMNGRPSGTRAGQPSGTTTSAKLPTRPTGGTGGSGSGTTPVATIATTKKTSETTTASNTLTTPAPSLGSTLQPSSESTSKPKTNATTGSGMETPKQIGTSGLNATASAEAEDEEDDDDSDSGDSTPGATANNTSDAADNNADDTEDDEDSSTSSDGAESETSGEQAGSTSTGQPSSTPRPTMGGPATVVAAGGRGVEPQGGANLQLASKEPKQAAGASTQLPMLAAIDIERVDSKGGAQQATLSTTLSPAGVQPAGGEQGQELARLKQQQEQTVPTTRTTTPTRVADESAADKSKQQRQRVLMVMPGESGASGAGDTMMGLETPISVPMEALLRMMMLGEQQASGQQAQLPASAPPEAATTRPPSAGTTSAALAPSTSSMIMMRQTIMTNGQQAMTSGTREQPTTTTTTTTVGPLENNETTWKKLQPPPTTRLPFSSPSEIRPSSAVAPSEGESQRGEGQESNQMRTTMSLGTTTRAMGTTGRALTTAVGQDAETESTGPTNGEPKIELLNMDLVPIQRLTGSGSTGAPTAGTTTTTTTIRQQTPTNQMQMQMQMQAQRQQQLQRQQQMQQAVDLISTIEPGMRLRPPPATITTTTQSRLQPTLSTASTASTMERTPASSSGRPLAPSMMSTLAGAPPATTITLPDQNANTVYMLMIGGGASDRQSSSVAQPMGAKQAGKQSSLRQQQQQQASMTTRLQPSGTSSGQQQATTVPMQTIAVTTTSTTTTRRPTTVMSSSSSQQMATTREQMMRQLLQNLTAEQGQQASGSITSTVAPSSTTTSQSAVTLRSSPTSSQADSQEKQETKTSAPDQRQSATGAPSSTKSTAVGQQQQQAERQPQAPNKGKVSSGPLAKTSAANLTASSASFIPDKLRNNFGKFKAQRTGSKQPPQQLAKLEASGRPEASATRATTQAPVAQSMQAIRQFGGANRMSALANGQPVAFGRPATMMMMSAGGAAGGQQARRPAAKTELPTFEYGPAIAVRRPDEPLANGQMPNCTLTGKNFCVLTKDYPMNEVRQAVERSFRSVRIMYEELQTVSDQELHKEDFANATSSQAASGKFACQTQVEMMRPGWAKDEITKEWMLVVNTDVFPQRVRTESCAQPNTPCEFIAPFYDSTCQQRYSLHRMIAIDPHDESRSPQVAVFKFPAGCVCRVHPIRKSGGQISHMLAAVQQQQSTTPVSTAASAAAAASAMSSQAAQGASTPAGSVTLISSSTSTSIRRKRK